MYAGVMKDEVVQSVSRKTSAFEMSNSKFETFHTKMTQYFSAFDVCVTVHHTYSNTNSQLNATITNFIANYIQFSMFRAIISPILRSTRLWYNTPTMLPAGSCIHSLVLLRIGEIIVRYILS